MIPPGFFAVTVQRNDVPQYGLIDVAILPTAPVVPAHVIYGPNDTVRIIAKFNPVDLGIQQSNPHNGIDTIKFRARITGDLLVTNAKPVALTALKAGV